MGGIGEERAVSIQSGTCVATALREAGMDVVTADITPDELSILESGDIDVFFIALHGKFGEDGQLQQIMEERGLVYTGSGPQASRVCFDKWECKKIFDSAGILTPPALQFVPGRTEKIAKKIAAIGDKFAVKPSRQGSSVGVTITSGIEETVKTAQRTFEIFGDCIIEKFIKGREITAAILCGQALPLIEVRSKNDFYDYKAKYEDNCTEYLFDTIEDTNLVKNIQRTALSAYRAAKCRHIARVDFMVDDKCPWALEINTIPGCTSHSLLPKAALRAGISMDKMVMKIVQSAVGNCRLSNCDSN